MGGNLNIEKSLDPTTSTSRQTVLAAENRAVEQREVQDPKQKEIADEGRRQELQRLQDAEGGSFSQERVEWRYSAPSSRTQGVSAEKEEHLLGRKQVDTLIIGKEDRIGRDAVALSGANGDGLKKVLQDPLLPIKRREPGKFAEWDSLRQIFESEKGREIDKETLHRRHRREEESRREERRRNRQADKENSLLRPRGLDAMRRVRDGRVRDLSQVRLRRRRSPYHGSRIIPSFKHERIVHDGTAALQAVRLAAENLEFSSTVLF
jgi:hypothetical protein